MKFSILCPTRNRPQNLYRFVSSIENTAYNPEDIEYLFYVDEDDQVSIKTLENYPATRVIVGPRVIFSSMFTILAKEASNPILFMTGDDVIMRTKDWDLKVEEEFSKVPDNLLVVSTMDGIQNEKLATHSFIHKVWVDILGYLVPPIFPGDWADNWLTDVSRSVNRLIYRSDIYVEHMHPNVGKGLLDETYMHKFKNTQIHRTEETYHQENAVSLRANDIAKLKGYIESKK